MNITIKLKDNKDGTVSIDARCKAGRGECLVKTQSNAMDYLRLIMEVDKKRNPTMQTAVELTLKEAAA
jgi:hypothetical protein